MKYLKSFKLNESTISDVELIFDRLSEEYNLELTRNSEHWIILHGDFKDNPIILDDKFIFILNTTNKKMNLDMDIVAVCRITYTDNKPIVRKPGGKQRRVKEMVGTLSKIVNLLKSSTDIIISMTEISISITI